MTESRVYGDGPSLAGAAAELFVTLAADAIAARGRFVVALSGGSTPRATYELLASHDFAARVCWRCVHVFWGDERSAPPDHADSNYRMARKAVLEKVPVPETNIHRICGELPPHEAAKAYTSELGAVLGKRGRFDLVLLGMGADGHTASLFPRSAALDERVAPVVPVYVERLRSWRVTLTLPVINASRNVVFLVRGAGKAGALARIRAGEPLPAGLVQPDSGQLIWLVDQQVITT